MPAEPAGPVTGLTCALVARASVTPEDAGCQRLIAERLLPLGFEAEWFHCGAVSNLLLTRGRARQHDAAIRASVGASLGRVVRLAFLEAFVLSAASSVVALLVCWWTQAALLSIVPPSLRGFVVSPFDPRTGVSGSRRAIRSEVIAPSCSGPTACTWPTMLTGCFSVARKASKSIRSRLKPSAPPMSIEALP